MTNLDFWRSASDRNNEKRASRFRSVQRAAADIVTFGTTAHIVPDSLLQRGSCWAAALFLLMTPHVVSAASFYVSPTGSDTNNGSQAAPFRTIRKAASVVSAGSTVHVAPGTYKGTIITTKSGTASARIRYVSDRKWGAKIIPPAGTSSGDLIWGNSGSYVDIEGFEIDGSSNPYFRTGISISGGYTRIFRNYVHDIVGTSPNAVGCCGGAGINMPSGGYTDTRPGEIFNNVIARIGDINERYRPGDWIPIHGIYLSNANKKVYNNIIYQIEANCITMGHNPQSSLVSNNLSFKCGVTGVQGCGVYLGARGNSSENYIAKNNTMQNNIAIDSRQAFCKNAYADDTNRWYNNISYRNGSGQYPSGIHSNLINADPKLVNYKADGTGDYHLAAGSPAIDSGRATGAPAADYDGAIGPIGSAFDRGAYEYGSGNVGGIR